MKSTIQLIVAISMITSIVSAANADNSAIQIISTAASDAFASADKSVGDFIVAAQYMPEAANAAWHRHVEQVRLEEAHEKFVNDQNQKNIDYQIYCRPAPYAWANGAKIAVTTVFNGGDPSEFCAETYGDQSNDWRAKK